MRRLGNEAVPAQGIASARPGTRGAAGPRPSMGITVYLAEPDPVQRRWLESTLAPHVEAVRGMDSAAALLGLLHDDEETCLIVDLTPDARAPVALVQQLRELGIAMPVIALGPPTALRSALELARLAATDYLPQPVSAGQLRAAVRRACAPR